jgi:hypothetical protein
MTLRAVSLRKMAEQAAELCNIHETPKVIAQKPGVAQVTLFL